ncbi:hypothetical protein [Bacteriovorax sp. Seq25_V]|uniref:hypothetical protein n=1 Tax=Bacteriovorax sp. Seq25_V TaxID=1201288 RepID=UPI00038A13EB|nr:hypothetical protein [Bacteriovorax sp. Seq25_V]EQC44207.1 hypothetical protein M900_A0359 [Bacteriovorax sp. Seq25_V]
MKYLLSVFMLAQLTFANVSVTKIAVNENNDPYFEISEIQVKELPPLKANHEALDEQKVDLKQIAMVIDGIIAIGKKIWPIIEAGKPVVDVNMGQGVSVIPFKKGDDLNATFMDMENWSAPVAKRYNVTYKNGFGAKVISFDYTVMFQHSGSFEEKGKYLTGVNVVASNISVAWGFDFKASTELVQISNHGSKDDRVAGATFKVNYTAETVFKTIQSADTFHVMGNGQLTKY